MGSGDPLARALGVPTITPWRETTDGWAVDIDLRPAHALDAMVVLDATAEAFPLQGKRLAALATMLPRVPVDVVIRAEGEVPLWAQAFRPNRILARGFEDTRVLFGLSQRESVSTLVIVTPGRSRLTELPMLRELVEGGVDVVVVLPDELAVLAGWLDDVGAGYAYMRDGSALGGPRELSDVVLDVMAPHEANLEALGVKAARMESWLRLTRSTLRERALVRVSAHNPRHLPTDFTMHLHGRRSDLPITTGRFARASRRIALAPSEQLLAQLAPHAWA